MGAGVVTVGRRSYAVGLYWENSPSGRVAQAAREAARHPGQEADFYALRAGTKDGRVPQFGLGQKAVGHKAGMPVFAACLANQQPGSWAGAFRLREGVVVIIIRDDLIVPDGDQFFANEGDARDRLLQEIGFGGLQRIYAPEAWAIPAADSMPISLLLDDRRDVRMRLVTIPKRILIGGGVAAGLLVLALGVGWYIQEKQAEEEAARQAVLAKQASDQNLKLNLLSQQPKYPPPDRKWEKKPTPMATVRACMDGLKQIPGTVAGWRLTQLHCDGRAVTADWSREKGISEGPKGAVVNESGTAAVLSITLPPVNPRGSEDLADPTVITNQFLAQDWPGNIARAQDDPPPPPPPGYQGQWTPPPPPWVKRSFTLSVPELPSSLGLYFGTLPGVIINALSYGPTANLTAGSWRIEGVIYENRD